MGYGTEILRFGLRKAKNIGLKSVYINCAKGNVASIKIIENNGGVLRKKESTESKSDSAYYKIKLT